ncbi:MAG: hypothetical protein WC713_04285 [Candidatus Methylomirabilota bacterium]
MIQSLSEPLYYDPETGKPSVAAFESVGRTFRTSDAVELAKLQMERDRLATALLWLEGGAPGEVRGVSIRNLLYMDLECQVRSAAPERPVFVLARQEARQSIDYRKGRLPLVLETIEEFIRQGREA